MAVRRGSHCGIHSDQSYLRSRASTCLHRFSQCRTSSCLTATLYFSTHLYVKIPLTLRRCWLSTFRLSPGSICCSTKTIINRLHRGQSAYSDGFYLLALIQPNIQNAMNSAVWSQIPPNRVLQTLRNLSFDVKRQNTRSSHFKRPIDHSLLPRVACCLINNTRGHHGYNLLGGR